MDELKELDRRIRRLRWHIIKLTVIWYGGKALYMVCLFSSAMIFFDPIQASLLGHEKLFGLGQGWWWLAVADLFLQYRIYREAARQGALGSINKPAKPSESEDEGDDDDHR